MILSGQRQGKLNFDSVSRDLCTVSGISNKKDRWIGEKPHHQQILLFDIKLLHTTAKRHAQMFAISSLENKCPALPGHEDMWYNTTKVHVGSVVRASCVEGYLVNDTDSITVTCNKTGTWSADIPPCLRKYQYNKTGTDVTTYILGLLETVKDLSSENIKRVNAKVCGKIAAQHIYRPFLRFFFNF